jgi:SAM-dependent methyltransferase
MWDERYNENEYVYGKAPNEFLVANYSTIPAGRVLSLAEGEGRNAVFLARQGYAVTAVDGSRVGLQKAGRLAKDNGVEIELVHADLVDYEIAESAWDGIVSIFCPLPAAIRSEVYGNAVRGLKSGGVFLLEAYTPAQIKYGTGGGNSVDTMTSKDSLLADLAGLHVTHLKELEREVIEGKYHTGLAAVVQAIARKAAGDT